MNIKAVTSPSAQKAAGEIDKRVAMYSGYLVGIPSESHVAAIASIIQEVIDTTIASQFSAPRELVATNDFTDDIGSWLSAALDDPKVCTEMKQAINHYFEREGRLAALVKDWRESAEWSTSHQAMLLSHADELEALVTEKAK